MEVVKMCVHMMTLMSVLSPLGGDGVELRKIEEISNAFQHSVDPNITAIGEMVELGLMVINEIRHQNEDQFENNSTGYVH